MQDFFDPALVPGLPDADYVPPPVQKDSPVADGRANGAADQGADEQGQANDVQLLREPGPRPFECEMLRGDVEHPAADEIAGEKDRGDGEGVGDPDEQHREGQVGGEHDGQCGRHDHLSRNGKECAEHPDRECPGHRTAVEVPQVVLQCHRTEQAKRLMLPDPMEVRKIFL